MEIQGIKYIAPVFDMSGYAQAARAYVIALHKLGIPLTITPVSFEDGMADFGEDGKIISNLVNKNINYNIVIIHLTVEHYEKMIEKDKFNIGYSIWETNRIHDEWVNWLNSTVDVCFTGSKWGTEVYKNSGVKIPIFTIPHTINVEDYDNITPYLIAGVPENAYKFYALFQFFERKHPTALIKAYWHAFQNNENVALVLKTYRIGFNEKEKTIVKETISRLKQVTPMDNYPPIYLVLDRLSRAEILGMHKACDCLVHLDRGEGFGLVPFESGAIGNPIIVTGWGGVTEYANPDNSYLVNSQLTPVFGMPWSPFYNGNQLWAEPDVYHGSQLMRHVYRHRNEAVEKGNKLRKTIKNNFSYEVIGNKIIEVIRSL